MLICNHWFLAVFTQQASVEKKDFVVIENNRNDILKRIFTRELRISLCVCVCVCVCRLYLRIVMCGRISNC